MFFLDIWLMALCLVWVYGAGKGFEMCTLQKPERGRCGRMVVGITTTGTCVISAHHHQVASSNSVHGEVYSMRENWWGFFFRNLIELKLYMNIEIIRSSTNFIFFVSIGYPRWPLSDKLNILLNIFLCIYFLLIHISNDILHSHFPFDIFNRPE
jgi:hypothetical protein